MYRSRVESQGLGSDIGPLAVSLFDALHITTALVAHDPTATVELPLSKVGVSGAKESPHYST